MTTLKFLFEITYLKSPKSFIWKRCALRAGHSAAGWRREIAFITFVVYIHHVRCLFSSRCTLYSSLFSSYRYKGTNMGKAQQKRKALKQQQPITQLALPLLKRPLVLHLWHNSLPSFWLCGVGKSTTGRWPVLYLSQWPHAPLPCPACPLETAIAGFRCDLLLKHWFLAIAIAIIPRIPKGCELAVASQCRGTLRNFHYSWIMNNSWMWITSQRPIHEYE